MPTEVLQLTDRVGRVRAQLADDGIDALVVTGRASVRWLAGYAGTNGLCVVTQHGQHLLTDARYAGIIGGLREAGWDAKVVDQDLLGVLAADLATHADGATRIGFESAQLTYASWSALAEGIAGTGAELVPTTGVLEGVRARKAPDEIELIRAGAEINDRIYEWLSSEGLDGTSEREWVRRIAERMRELGAEGPSFDTIVAAGASGSSPHSIAGGEPIERNTLVVVDLGSIVAGYNSDCTRTFATGHTEGEMREVYEVVLRAQEAALALVRPGVACADVHEAARAVIDDAGYGDHFNHGTGHGVGIEIHELPRLRAGGPGVLEAGNVVTVEPGVYLPERFGVRIEDLVVVTEEGHEVLSRFPKSLLDVG